VNRRLRQPLRNNAYPNAAANETQSNTGCNKIMLNRITPQK
jgi:hypothetical protein